VAQVKFYLTCALLAARKKNRRIHPAKGGTLSCATNALNTLEKAGSKGKLERVDRPVFVVRDGFRIPHALRVTG